MPSGSKTASVRYRPKSMSASLATALGEPPRIRSWSRSAAFPAGDITSSVCIAYPEAWANRWRTVEPGGPAGVSSSSTPSSTAICTARATNGLVTDASAKRCADVAVLGQNTGRIRPPPRRHSRTGQSAIASSADTGRSLIRRPRRDDRGHVAGVGAAAPAEHPDRGQPVRAARRAGRRARSGPPRRVLSPRRTPHGF